MGISYFKDYLKKTQLLACEGDNKIAIKLLFVKCIDEMLLWDQFATEHLANHKKIWASASLCTGSSSSKNGCIRLARDIKKEVAKKKASLSYDSLDELADHMQNKSEHLVEGKHSDDILCFTTGMGVRCKTLIRKMCKMYFEEDF